ncbi:hypothetical protein SAMN05192588_0312 [Nonlabens sp. Hel1_33_55]|uniref:HAD domain-containing protein n=1 Tax=Nonlabens sp. Hel1_33_55 TaxID=1336802 RepID=UPI000875AAF2|nr:HAD domain-containing protein [Nonlabens sp. Hel1_33_55]SCX93075.1 hypothetical protein SAMN05192588_0312 [Nonlabens sp. Hel1_33_55]
MLIYLDIDGVMVAANSWRRPNILDDGFAEFTPQAVKALNKILEFPETSIVLTTSHKHHFSLDQWKEMFRIRNIDIENIQRLPENNENLNRKEELMLWFQKTEIKDHFIIIDDDKSLNALSPYLKYRLIQTNASVGLTDHLADQALTIMSTLDMELI